MHVWCSECILNPRGYTQKKNLGRKRRSSSHCIWFLLDLANGCAKPVLFLSSRHPLSPKREKQKVQTDLIEPIASDSYLILLTKVQTGVSLLFFAPYHLSAWCFCCISLDSRGPAIYVSCIVLSGWLHVCMAYHWFIHQQLLLFILNKTWRVWVHHSS